MSGGSFDYAYSRVSQFADELEIKLFLHDKINEWGDRPYAFEPETMDKLRQIGKLARLTSELMREAEWLYSGDTGDDSFMKRVEKIDVRHVLSQDLG